MFNIIKKTGDQREKIIFIHTVLQKGSKQGKNQDLDYVS